ncbi:MAG: nucleoside hydrolase [Candidatus Nanopelagicaceae bacterium]
MAEKIIFDTDPGIDDALALLLLAAAPELDLLAITVTHGNTSQEKCLSNALKLVELLGIEQVPVARGAQEPLVKELSVAEETHGDGGLGYAVLPEPKVKPIQESAHDLIIRLVNENPGQITLLCVGPMTNIALALLKQPQIAKNIKRIVAMGGSIHYPGNSTPQSEYNVFCDPESYEIVLNAGVDFTLVPLDVTYQCLLTTQHIEQITLARPEIKNFIKESTRFYIEFHAKYQGIQGCAINDPLAAAILIDPTLVENRDYFLSVDLSGGSSRAKTIADHYGALKKAPNAKVSMTVEVDRFMKQFIERMNRLN